MKQTQQAFTLIEMMMVIALIGVIASVVLPRLVRKSPHAEWYNILDELNAMSSFARQEAIAHHAVFRLAFASKPQGIDEVRVEEEKEDPEKPGRKIYNLVKSYYFPTTYTFHKDVKIVAVYLGKQELLAEQKNIGTCYIASDGLVQGIIVHLLRKINGVESKGSYKMNPFFGTFEFLEGFIKSER